MLFLFFPKMFEYLKFKITLKEHFCYNFLNDNLNFDIYIYKLANRKNYCFCCKVIDKSDIDFLLDLNEFFIKLKSFFKEDVFKIKFLIFGTCGYFKIDKNIKIMSENGCISRSFYVTNATKYDRGELGKNRKFIRRNKELDVKLNSKYDNNTLTFSGNMLCTTSYLELNSFFNEIKQENTGIVEMETFDFMKICQNHKFDCIGAVRIVSDVCNGNDNKICRLLCDFNSGILHFEKLLEKHTNYKYSREINIELDTEDFYQIISLINTDILAINSLIKTKELKFKNAYSLESVKTNKREFYNFLLTKIAEKYYNKFDELINKKIKLDFLNYFKKISLLNHYTLLFICFKLTDRHELLEKFTNYNTVNLNEYFNNIGIRNITYNLNYLYSNLNCIDFEFEKEMEKFVENLYQKIKDINKNISNSELSVCLFSQLKDENFINNMLNLTVNDCSYFKNNFKISKMNEEKTIIEMKELLKINDFLMLPEIDKKSFNYIKELKNIFKLSDESEIELIKQIKIDNFMTDYRNNFNKIKEIFNIKNLYINKFMNIIINIISTNEYFQKMLLFSENEKNEIQKDLETINIIDLNIFNLLDVEFRNNF